jgi:cell division protein FtsL
MIKKVMKQDQEIERQEKLLNDKDEEIKSLSLVKRRIKPS